MRNASTHAFLDAYRPADAAETADLEAMRALLARDADVFVRTHFAPGHFTASAFVVSPEGDALLLVKHPKLGRWLQPGGHVEPEDMDLAGAALREAREETGLRDLTPLGRGIFDVDVHVIPARKDEPEHRHFDVRFAFRAATRELRLEAGISDARWVPLHEVTAENSDASVARAAGKLARG